MRQRWAEGRPAFCTAVSSRDPSIVELIASLGFDCIWMDLEHGARSVETFTDLARAARTGNTDVMARPGKGELMRMGRLLEAGAHGILYPRCESVDDASDAVRWSKFAPLGERGFDGGNADASFGLIPTEEYVLAANAETFLAVQIESPGAVPHSRAIAELEGVDLLFFGPGDYSVLVGAPGRIDAPEVLTAMEQVAADARAAGKGFASIAFSPEHVRRLLDMGATLVNYLADTVVLKQGYQQMQDTFGAMGFAFDPG